MPRILAQPGPGSRYPIWRGDNPFEDEKQTEKMIEAVYWSREYAQIYMFTLLGLLVLHMVRYNGRKLYLWAQKGHAQQRRFLNFRFLRKIDQCLLYHPEGEGRLDIATHLVSVIFMAATVFLLFYDIPNVIIYGFRSGFVIAINFPVLYILGAKKTPLSFLVGWSYDQLNVFHQVVGIACVYASLLHAAVFGYYFHPLYLLTEWWSLWGIIAFVAFVAIGLTSNQRFREKHYEVFYVIHVVGMILSIIGLYWHITAARPFAVAAGLSVVYDRLARAADGYRVAKGYLELHSGDTIVVKIPKSQPRQLVKKFEYYNISNPLNLFVFVSNVFVRLLNAAISIINHQTKLKWHSGQHMFITFVKCRLFESHPFTISSSYDHEDNLEFIIRVRNGFTKSLKEKLLKRMEDAGSERDPRSITWTVILHGPYGVKPLGLFQPGDKALLNTGSTSYGSIASSVGTTCTRKILLISGGSGVAFTYPLMLQLAHQKREVEFIWIVPDRSYATWVDLSHPRVQNASVLIHETKSQGRPDITQMVQTRLKGSTSHDWVCVCGPDMLLRQVRNNVAELRGEGQSVELFAERFGW